MAFKFNMQKVLDYREQLEEEAKVKLGKAEYELDLAEKNLQRLQKEFAAAQEASMGKVMRSSDRWLHDQFMKGLRNDITQAGLQTRMARQIADEARKLVAARSMDRKILENLKQKQAQNYIKSENKQEQNFNDEIATIRYKASSV